MTQQLSAVTAICVCLLTAPLLAHASDDDTQLVRARAAVADYQRQLGGQLKAALAEAGPVGAIAVCSERAPAIAEAVGRDHWRGNQTGCQPSAQSGRGGASARSTRTADTGGTDQR